MKIQRHHSSPDHHSFPNMISPSNGMHTQNALGSNQNPFSLSPGVVVDAEKRKRNRTFIDPVSEVPRLEEWFILNTHPSHALIARYTDELNRLPYRQKVRYYINLYPYSLISQTRNCHYMILSYLDLNNFSFQFPRLEQKNVQFWFKNRRAKCKRMNIAGGPSCVDDLSPINQTNSSNGTRS